LDKALNEAIEQGNLTRNWIVSDNWALDYGLLPQNPVGGPSDAQMRTLNQAFADAGSAIAPWKRGKNPCLEFFTSGRSLEEISKILKNFWNTASVAPNDQHAILGTRGEGMDARVTAYAPFFAQNGETVAGKLAGYDWSQVNQMYLERFTNLSPRQYRALGILHEFAHALGLIPHDGNDTRGVGSQSQKNDQTIYQKCGKFLDSLPLQ